MPKLNALTIKNITHPGLYPDGDKLYLSVQPGGTRSWIFRYQLRGRRREMGLGPLDLISLSDARKAAADARLLIQAGTDPLDARAAAHAAKARAEAEAAAAGEVTFYRCLQEYLNAHGKGWKERQREDWRNSLRRHMAKIVDEPIREIRRETIVAELEKIWDTKRVMAHRVQERVEKVMGYARVKHYRDGENPATWKNNLSFLLSPKSRSDGHFIAMKRDEVPEFFARLATFEGASFRALELIILNATRTNECVGADWSELEFDRGLWRIPGGKDSRMKAKREHVIPLARQSIERFRALHATRQSQWVFPSRLYGRHLSQMACLEVMRGLGRHEHVHGFRSTFKDWATDCTDYPDLMSEFALAHEIDDETKKAYMRTKMVERRRQLMQDWADFVTSAMK